MRTMPLWPAAQLSRFLDLMRDTEEVSFIALPHKLVLQNYSPTPAEVQTSE